MHMFNNIHLCEYDKCPGLKTLIFSKEQFETRWSDGL
jgi:hypothetical protein